MHRKPMETLIGKMGKYEEFQNLNQGVGKALLKILGIKLIK